LENGYLITIINQPILLKN